MPEPLRIVVALGGNAILRRGERGTIDEQFAHADEAMAHVSALVADGHRLALTHGNGPVVGNIVLRGEAARAKVAPMPLYIAGADSEGGIGLMLQTSLANALRARGLTVPVATLVTSTLVDPADPAFAAPTKPIGPYYDTYRKQHLAEEEPGWSFREYPGTGWRRVVASPEPLRIVEAPTVSALLDDGICVIAAGGGGVPVAEDASGRLHGVDAVIDKDLASALLAEETCARALVILMEADRVYLDFGTPKQRPLDRLTLAEARRLLEQGAFDRGSMAPKVEACCRFVEHCGEQALICRAEDLPEALAGRAGTAIARD